MSNTPELQFYRLLLNTGKPKTGEPFAREELVELFPGLADEIPPDIPPPMPRADSKPKPPSPQLTEEKMRALLQNTGKPDGKPYTNEEFAELFPLLYGRKREPAKEDVVFVQPEVRKNPPTNHEKAFFTGAVVSGIKVFREKERDSEYIKTFIKTGKTPEKKQVVKDILGAWGDTFQMEKRVGVLLNHEQFGFMKEISAEEINKILKTKDLFAPFLLGLIKFQAPHENSNSLRVSEKYLQKSTQPLADRIVRYFKKHFFRDLGTVLPGEQGETMIATQDLDEILGILKTNKGVKSLSFFASLFTSPNGLSGEE